MKKIILISIFIFVAFNIALNAQIIFQRKTYGTINIYYAYYECSNKRNSFVKFVIPDTINKRTIAIERFSCKPMPRPVMINENRAIILGEIR